MHRFAKYFSIALILLTVAPAALVAQEPAAGDAATALAEPAADAPATEHSTTTLGKEIFRAPTTAADWVGYAFYFVLFVFSLITATVTCERVFHLTRSRIMPPSQVQQLQELIRTGRDTRDNLQALAKSSPSPLANVLKDALLRAGRPLVEVEKGIEDAMAREIVLLRGRHRVLGVMANVAPLVGLFGTVVGIMFAFQIASQEGLGQAEVLARGIYLALVTTALGLTIAVPAMLFVAWFNAKVERYMIELDGTMLQTLPSFARMERTTSPAHSENGTTRREASPASEERSRADGKVIITV